MRIAVVSRAIIPGGHVVWATGLCRGLKELGHQPTVVYIRDSSFVPMFQSEFGGLATEYTFQGFLARVSESLGWPASLALLGGGYGIGGSPDPISWILAPLVGQWTKRFDLLVFAEDFTAVGGLIANRLTGTPYVVFVHEAAGGRADSLSSRLLERLRRTARRNALLTCAIDEAIAHTLIRNSESHVATVPLGCDPVKEIQQPKGTFVLADSRWTPARNPSFLLEVARHTPGVNYVMIGSFWTPDLEREFRSSLRASGLEGQIRLTPNLTALEATTLYRQAMVYIRWAAFGTGGWEMGFPTGLRIALSNSCPVLFDRNLGCAPYLAEDLANAQLEHSAELFAIRIRELKSNPGLVLRLSNESLAFARKHSWTNSARQMMQNLTRP